MQNVMTLGRQQVCYIYKDGSASVDASAALKWMLSILYFLFITGPPTHSVGGQTSNGRCHLSSSVTLHGGPAGGFAHAGQAMTSCRLQSNYSYTVTLHGGPVVLRPVRATPCFLMNVWHVGGISSLYCDCVNNAKLHFARCEVCHLQRHFVCILSFTCCDMSWTVASRSWKESRSMSHPVRRTPSLVLRGLARALSSACCFGSMT